MRSCQNDKAEADESTKYGDTETAQQLRKGQSLRPYLTPYFTSKLKGIASKIRSNACKRFKTKDCDGDIRLVFWSEFKQISDASKDKSIIKEDMTINEVESLIKKERIKLFHAENVGRQKNKRAQTILTTLNESIIYRKEKEVEISVLKAKNKRTLTLILYWNQLCLIKNQSQQICQKKKAQIQNVIHQIKEIKKQIKQIPLLHRIIGDKEKRYQQLSLTLAQSQQKVDKLINQQIPNLLQMTNCMFYIGILTQQIHVLILQKKQKMNQADKGVNKSFKIHQKLARRQIHIQCNNKETIQLKTLITIYMHCKSLTINNIVTVMNTLSFFSEEFKQFYNYRLFQQYVSVLIQRLKLHTIKQIQWKRQNLQPELLKRKLIIIVKPQHLPFMKWILQPFQIGNNIYSLYLGPYQMLIGVQLQDIVDQLQKQEVTVMEYNELKIHFTNSGLQQGKLKYI